MLTLKPILEIAALILTLVNGLMLLRVYLLDRPILRVAAVHPNTYQWFFRLPPGEHDGQAARRYGFLAYIDVINKGRRDVGLSVWKLRGRTKGYRQFEEEPLSIQEPQITIRGAYTKAYPVLGTQGALFQGETMVKSGASVSGFCYYVVEFFGHSNWDLRVHDGTTAAHMVVHSIFGNTAKTKVVFKEISLQKAEAVIPGIANIDRANEEWNDLAPPTPKTQTE